MRIASGGVQHETNTFSNTPTTLEDFIRDSQCGPGLAGGATIIDRYADTGCVHGGYIAGAKEAGYQLLPLLSTKATPSGVVKQATFDHILNEFLQRLQQELPVDGVLLDLHGAMVTEEYEDAEGAFTKAVRELVGPRVPIIVTLDLHANISPQLSKLADVIIGYDTYPHVDMFDRGREAALLMARIVRGEVAPTMEYRQLPLLTMPPMQCTLREPMQSLIAGMHELENELGVLTATIAMGFPFADIRDAGVTVLVTTNHDRQLANETADALAKSLWEARDSLQPQLTTIESAIDYARGQPPGQLAIFADGSDNPGGGAPCDGTVALQAMIDAKLEGGMAGVLYDPETAAQAHAAGVGATIQVRLGGKTDDQHGATIVADATVAHLSEGSFVYEGPMLNGVKDNLGPTATLSIHGVLVAVSSLRRQCLDVAMLKTAGIDPTSGRLLVVKSAVHFRASIGPLASRIFDADTPGIHRPDFGNYHYVNLRRPIYPLDNVNGM